jgi:hypothetical protein
MWQPSFQSSTAQHLDRVASLSGLIEDATKLLCELKNERAISGTTCPGSRPERSSFVLAGDDNIKRPSFFFSLKLNEFDAVYRPSLFRTTQKYRYGK